MDPDKPHDDDPDIDAMSMLEVIGDTRASAEARMAASREMMAPYAIRAILDGADPRQVAEACGFRAGGQSRPQQISVMEAMLSNAFGSRITFDDDVVEQMQDGQSGGMNAFIQWITGKLADIVRESHGLRDR